MNEKNSEQQPEVPEGSEREVGRVRRVSGPLVVAEGLTGAEMHEMVRVGEDQLFGEVIEIRRDAYSIQVYEETEGIGPGAPVHPTGDPLSVELGPGLISAVYDGVQRPLDILEEQWGAYIVRGAQVDPLDREKLWTFEPSLESGEQVETGDVLGVVQETAVVEHRIMVPPGASGELVSIEEGEHTITDTIAVIAGEDGETEVTMSQRWPVREARGVQRKLAPETMLLTGQRVIDMFFPLAKGGTACIPGPFGSGKTVIQHQLSKWADAEIIVYVGCGERGNEMTDVLMEFPELTDPRTGEPLMKRTVLVANTSNMPVAARDASVFTGITIAEYFRDMGYSVALMADSTSRWAEAMREISGRLEEMPGEEGYPPYLASEIANFYERAGRAVCYGQDGREGSLSLIGAVSPPGGDLSDPVVQATLRVVQVFWSLEDDLASARHFPAISWLRSYSLYQDAIDDWANEKVHEDWSKNRGRAMAILQKESELEELVRLVGMESLSGKDRLLMEVARMIREDFLHQNAFDEIDTYTALEKQYRLLNIILHYDEQARDVLEAGVQLEDILGVEAVEDIARAKFIPEEEMERFDEIDDKIEEQLKALRGGEDQMKQNTRAESQTEQTETEETEEAASG
ncbi:MAG: V-type ATP synthase subunit A [Planctomycetes bacterium]|nr:V-type ATP synthase subunit A [Planctomycetota bacterium]